MTLEQVQDLEHPLLMSTDTFSSWLKSTAETARHHLMNSQRSYRLQRKNFEFFYYLLQCFFLAHVKLRPFLCVYRKFLLLVKSSWSMICSREKLPPSHPAAAAAISPPSPPVNIVPSLSWAAATPLQPSVMAVPRPSQVTVSHCSVHWPLTQPSDRSWSSRVSSESCLSITCGEAQQP